MTASSVENFFDNTGGGSGAPSIKMSQVNDGVKGVIVDQFMAPAYKFGTKDQKLDAKTGKPVEQLVVILETNLRDWARVARVPVVDPTEQGSPPKPASEDDGRRAIYLEPFTNLHAAVGKAIVAATGRKGPLLNGGTLGVKVSNLRDTGKGNPLKEHAAVYEPPVASSGGFFDQGAAAEPASQAAPASREVSEEPPF